MIDFDGRTVLVTGAAGGIGSATARRIAGCGGNVVLHDIDAGRLEGLSRELAGASHAVSGDLSELGVAAAVWQEALAWREPVDALVNNAGIYEPASIDDDLGDWMAAWNRMLSICLVSPATLCREAIRTFRAQPGGGTIVNLASRAAWRGDDADYWHYAAAKAGVIAMTKTIARQFGRDGVTAFAVAPGFVNTPFNDPAVQRYGLESFAEDTGLGEVAGPEDVANVIAFLASGLARHATGTTVDVNGASYVR